MNQCYYGGHTKDIKLKIKYINSNIINNNER